MRDDEYFLRKAIEEAKKAYYNSDVPVGCLIVINGKIISKSYNQRHLKKNALYHAEILAIDKACKKLNKWILDDATMYVTLEPCVMCSGAIIQSRIKRLVYGAKEPKYGCAGSNLDILSNNNFNHKVEVVSGILEEEVSLMMSSFFKELRIKKSNNK